MKKMISLFLIVMLIAVLAIGCGQQPTDTKKEEPVVKFPEKRITLTIPYNAGGGTDLVGRVLAENMEKHLGQPVVVVNKPGGGSANGMMEVARTAPDGYNIVLAATPLTTLRTATSVDIGPDNFEAVIGINVNDFALAVKADAPWKTLEDLMEEIEKNPGTIKVGTTSPGGAWHTAAVVFNQITGGKTDIVPFGGGTADMMPALLGGHLAVGTMDIAEAAPHLNSNTLRVLAIGGDKRYSAYPDIPTFSELGIDIFRACAIRGLMAPKGTPQEVIDVLYNAAKAATEEQSFIEFMDTNVFNIDIYTPQEWSAFLDEQYQGFIEIYNQIK